MKIWLYSVGNIAGIQSRFEYVTEQLSSQGYNIGWSITDIPNPVWNSRQDYMIFSHTPYGPANQFGKHLAGTRMHRTESLSLVNQAGMQTCEYVPVNSETDIIQQINDWNVDFGIVKKSGSWDDNGIFVVRANQTSHEIALEEGDVLCKDVNTNNGDIYKAEIFAGEICNSWKINKLPISQRITPDGDTRTIVDIPPQHRAKPSVSRPERDLFTFPVLIQDQLKILSSNLTDLNIGYASVDMMLNPQGDFEVVELNFTAIQIIWGDANTNSREIFINALKEFVA